MIVAALRKELLLVAADRGGLLALFVMPVVFMAVFGAVFSGGDSTASVPAAIVASGFQLAVPGNAVLFGFFLALTIAISFVDERKRGTMRRIYASPVRRSWLLIAKLVPYFLVGVLQMTFLFTTGVVVFGLEIGGSLVALVVLTMAVVACATALGLLIASFSGSQKQVGGVGSITLLVLSLLGGTMIPRSAMPAWLQDVGLVTPHAWALDGYYELLLHRGGTLGDIFGEVAVLVGLAVVFAGLGAARLAARTT